MNPLQEHGNLFANGEFKVRWDHEGVDFTEIIDLKKEAWILKNPKVLSNCTLIARPIEDMSDEELYEAHLVSDSYGDVDEYNIEEWRKVLTQWVNLDEIKFATARYLLSIKVLPFPQKHFGDTVIDTRTLKTA